jgi:hypothetical protein
MRTGSVILVVIGGLVFAAGFIEFRPTLASGMMIAGAVLVGGGTIARAVAGLHSPPPGHEKTKPER